MELGFELSASKQALCCMKYTSSPFCFGYFGDGGLLKYLLGLHTHVYCSTIHNSQDMETAKMPHY
jgi:hypothetical protein